MCNEDGFAVVFVTGRFAVAVGDAAFVESEVGNLIDDGIFGGFGGK